MTVRVPRIPAPGETVLGRHFYITAGGKGANQAVAAARAGGAVFFVTAVGTDDFGERALANFVREGINVDFVRRVPGVPSGVALICVDESGENNIAVAPGANQELRPENVEPPARLFGRGDVILLQLEIPIDTVQATARMAMEQGARVILNPAPAQPVPDSVFELVSTVTPNEVEVEQLTGFGLNDESGLQRAAAVLHERGVRDVLITRAPAASSCRPAAFRKWSLPSQWTPSTRLRPVMSSTARSRWRSWNSGPCLTRSGSPAARLRSPLPGPAHKRQRRTARKSSRFFANATREGGSHDDALLPTRRNGSVDRDRGGVRRSKLRNAA